MPVIRSEVSKKSEYYLPKHVFLETYHFCCQYPDWVVEYAELENQLKGITYDKEKVDGGKAEDPMVKLAIRREELWEKIRIIEEAAAEVIDPAFREDFIKAMTTANFGWEQVHDKLNLPYGRKPYLKMRRKFYFLVERYRRNGNDVVL